MEWLFGSEWHKLFLPSAPIAQLLVRGSVTYLGLFATLRFILKRQSGAVSITDMLLIVLIGSAVQNGMNDDYHSITDGLILVVTIIFWNYALDWLGYQFPGLQPYVHPPQLQLMQDGRIQWQNMRRELITEGELRSQIREQGIEDMDQVKDVYLEGDGKFSIITYEQPPKQREASERKGL